MREWCSIQVSNCIRFHKKTLSRKILKKKKVNYKIYTMFGSRSIYWGGEQTKTKNNSNV